MVFPSPNSGQFSKELVLFHYLQLGTPNGEEQLDELWFDLGGSERCSDAPGITPLPGLTTRVTFAAFLMWFCLKKE